MINSKTFLVMVYGSLKRGFGNHSVLEESEFLGATETAASKYDLVSLGPFPAALNHGTHNIKGELYSVDRKTLKNLDILESNGKFYNREPVRLIDGTIAWVYFLSDAYASYLRLDNPQTVGRMRVNKMRADDTQSLCWDLSHEESFRVKELKKKKQLEKRRAKRAALTLAKKSAKLNPS